MYCKFCGKSIPDDSRFCQHCGNNLEQNQTNDTNSAKPDNTSCKQENTSASENCQSSENNEYSEQQSQTSSFASSSDSESNQNSFDNFQMPEKPQNNNDTIALIVNILSFVFAAIFLWRGFSSIVGIISGISSLPYIFRFYPLYVITMPLTIIISLISIVLGGLLIVFGLQRTRENTDGLFLGLSVCGLVFIVFLFIRELINLSFFGRFSPGFGSYLLLPIVCVGGIFGLLYVMHQAPSISSFAENTGAKFSEAIKDIVDAIKNLVNRFTNPNNTAAASTPNFQQNVNSQNFQQTQNTQQQTHYVDPLRRPLMQDRSLVVYIILSIITCGIYNLYTIYSIANDVNTICREDGRKTSGLLAFILLNIITCGLYSFYWYYSVGNRLSANAPRYNIILQENGTTLLLWLILGSWLCGIGYWVAYYILFKNLNVLAASYNNRNF